MNAYIDFVHGLIYGSTLSTNHKSWLGANPSPTGQQWLDHHLDTMFASFNTWNTAQELPPVTPWNGEQPSPWDTSLGSTLPSSLQPPFSGLTTLEQLGAALRDWWNTCTTPTGSGTMMNAAARELSGDEKAPFSYRYWSFMKWAKDLRERFLGNPVLPTGVVYDRDGTILSAKVFCDTFNDLHRNWHQNVSTFGTQRTPGLHSAAGQRVGTLSSGVSGLTLEEDFIRFHRDHLWLFQTWLARSHQGPVELQDMGMSGGWPTSSTTWVPPSPWIAGEGDATSSLSFQGLATLDDVGIIHASYHNSGHNQNSDIGPLPHNNYVPRFHMWHGWIDSQWWWREPRFAWSDPVTGARERRFRPVRQDGSDFQSRTAISIVRDPLASADTIHPANALGFYDLSSGAGTLRMQLYVRDPFGRNLRMRLTAEVLDAAGAVISALSVVTLRTIGSGGDHALNTDFFEDISIPGAFTSDDPTRANPAVGFVHARVRIIGELWVPNAGDPDNPAASPDAGFVHRDEVSLDLVREKLAPEPTLTLDLSSFSQGHVDAVAVSGESRFPGVFFLIVQDRTETPVADPVWPTLLANEVKGLLRGLPAASGLFDDLPHAPTLELVETLTNAPLAGVSAVFESAPTREDPTLDPCVPQRHTWSGTLVFAAGHAAFSGMVAGDRRTLKLRATVRDRAGNAATVEAPISLFIDANPFMTDGAPSWLSVDTRVLSIEAGETRLGTTLSAGAPRTWLSSVLSALRLGTTGGETFEGLPSDSAGSALEYAQSRVNSTTGTATPVYNFALAKVRLRGTTGASAVRAFFRLFRYSAPNLLFDGARGYRSYADGLGKVVPLPGFDGTSSGAELLSIPFFAAARKDATTDDLSTQTDSLNVADFPSGISTEQVLYFGAWLDFNQPDVRLPASFDPGVPHGPFTSGTQSLATLMLDFHQCMVVEIRYDADPTEPGLSPGNSDNLAQRNLTLVNSANPGDTLTRTVEHSFLIDLAAPPALRAQRDKARAHNDAHIARILQGDALDHGPAAEGPLLPGDGVAFTEAGRFGGLLHEEVMNLGMFSPLGARLMKMHRSAEQAGHAAAATHGQGGEHDAKDPVASLIAHTDVLVRRTFPFVFESGAWTETTRYVDELMLRWGRLPEGTEARLMLSGVSAEAVESLRALRHAPRTVWSEGGGVLRLDPHGITYIPIPPNAGGKVAALLRLTLPAGVRAGQRYSVDIVQLQGGTVVNKGGVRFQVNVEHAERFIDRVTTGVEHLHAQLSLTPAQSVWRPILAQRLRSERERAKALSAYIGRPWTDPTVWSGPDGRPVPIRGPKLRVVLESIQVIDDHDPWIKARGEFQLRARVGTSDNGGAQRTSRLPAHGVIKLGSGESARLNATLFEGYAYSHLAIRLDLTEEDLFDKDDDMGRFMRTFRGDPEGWFGSYAADGTWSCEEDLGAWQVSYRIERA